MKKSLWRLKHSWRLLEAIAISGFPKPMTKKRKYLRVLVNIFTFCFHDGSPGLILYWNLWQTNFKSHCMLHCHACFSVYSVILEQIHLWFYSTSWLSYMKYFSLYARLYRNSIRQDRFYESWRITRHQVLKLQFHHLSKLVLLTWQISGVQGYLKGDM